MEYSDFFFPLAGFSHESARLAVSLQGAEVQESHGFLIQTSSPPPRRAGSEEGANWRSQNVLRFWRLEEGRAPRWGWVGQGSGRRTGLTTGSPSSSLDGHGLQGQPTEDPAYSCFQDLGSCKAHGRAWHQLVSLLLLVPSTNKSSSINTNEIPSFLCLKESLPLILKTQTHLHAEFPPPAPAPTADHSHAVPNPGHDCSESQVCSWLVIFWKRPCSPPTQSNPCPQHHLSVLSHSGQRGTALRTFITGVGAWFLQSLGIPPVLPTPAPGGEQPWRSAGAQTPRSERRNRKL